MILGRRATYSGSMHSQNGVMGNFTRMPYGEDSKPMSGRSDMLPQRRRNSSKGMDRIEPERSKSRGDRAMNSLRLTRSDPFKVTFDDMRGTVVEKIPPSAKMLWSGIRRMISS